VIEYQPVGWKCMIYKEEFNINDNIPKIGRIIVNRKEFLKYAFFNVKGDSFDFNTSLLIFS
jgi:hypothetical protein